MEKNIVIVGATGAVGREALSLLEKLKISYDSLKLLSSERSAGKKITVNDKEYTVEALSQEAFKGQTVALFCANGAISKEFASKAVKEKCIVIDNSSAFRMERDVPLIVPEINSTEVKKHKGIIANPNCSTIISLLGLGPLHNAFGLKRFFACTYQAVSGSGVQGIEELKTQLSTWVKNKDSTNVLKPNFYPHPIAFNVLPCIDKLQENGYTYEEEKMAQESRKILQLPELKVSTTCVRVPTLRAHAIAIQAEFAKPVHLLRAQNAILNAPGVNLMDDPKNGIYPTPLAMSQKMHCALGRLRIDSALENGLSFFISGDQLWKGAALNAIQIMQLLLN